MLRNLFKRIYFLGFEWAHSLAWKSTRLLTGGSGVQIPLGPYLFAGVAEWSKAQDLRACAKGYSPSKKSCPEEGSWVRIPPPALFKFRKECPRSSVVERHLGKVEVPGSIPGGG